MKAVILALLWGMVMILVRHYAVIWTRKGRIPITVASILIASVWALAPVLFEATGVINFGVVFAAVFAVLDFLVALAVARILLPVFLDNR